MTIEKSNIEDILKQDIGEINKNMLCSVYELQKEDNRLSLMDMLSDYFGFGDGEKYFYSDDSDWTKFFKSKVVEWFGEEHGLVLIDKEYWLLAMAIVDKEDIKFWDLSSMKTDNLDMAKKLVKLVSVTEEIGRENDQQSADNGKCCQ